MHSLRPLQRRSVVDEAYEALRAQILHGTWEPGDAVPTEAELTRVLGVSRSTVREALNRLASAGLIRIPHGGTKVVCDYRDSAGLETLAALVVTPAGIVNLRIVRDVTEMRAAIAPDVARRAALRRTDAQARRLHTAAAAIDPDASLDELMVDTLHWWTELVLASDNLAYRLAYNTLRSTYTEGRAALQQVIAPELRHAAGYRAVSDAIEARRSDDAAAACAALVALGTDALLTAIPSGA